MDMPLDTIMDLAIILLLVPTIVYAVILNRRLSALRNSRDELAKVVGSFNEATMRAEAGIPKLKKATLEANNALQERVVKAHSLRDDLAFMIERAEEMADKLDGSVKSGRAMDAAQQAAPAIASTPVRPTQHRPAPPMSDAPAPSRTLAGAAIANARDVFNYTSENSSLKRNVNLDELGNSALYLVSDLSSAITGEIHYVDCGFNIIGMPKS